MKNSWFKNAYRRLLVDLHIPDWDEDFLSRYDPQHLLDCYRTAQATAVMFYCQSHVGLCYWPTKTGRMHAATKGQDWVGMQLTLLKQAGMAACAYYSVNYNNWAYWEHPEWRIEHAGDNSRSSFRHSRYGICCPNNPGYRAFVLAQLAEIAEGYDVDGFFVDDTFWPTVCVCSHCRALYREQYGAEIPDVIDWTSPEWCQFQAAREKWMSDYTGTITAHIKSLRPEVTVYHNFGPALNHWSLGVPLSSAVHHDFLGCDLFGDPMEQLVATRLISGLSENRPGEFMTSHTIGVREHVQQKRFEQMRLQVYAAMLNASAFLFIDWIDPTGDLNPAPYEKIGRIYNEIAPYEEYLGGEPIEEIAVYYSNESKMSFAENGDLLSDVDPWVERELGPHIQAVRGVCRNLQQSHVPFGIITRKQLSQLDQYKAVILPNVLRMDAEEVEALRHYVHGGGKLYASRYTSLTDTQGVRHGDFMLSDVFGCHFEADDIGSMSYLKPESGQTAACAGAQRYISLSQPLVMFGSQKDKPSAKPIRLQPGADGSVLGRLTLPYANDTSGTVEDHQWSSIHSSPPWQETEHPVMVSHTYGQGRVVYSAADIEMLDTEATNTLFQSLIYSLIDEPLIFTTDAHPCVWTSIRHQPERNCLIVCFLNYQTQLPAIPIPKLTFCLRPCHGKYIVKLLRLPDQTDVPFTAADDGRIQVEIEQLEIFQMLMAVLAEG